MKKQICSACDTELEYLGTQILMLTRKKKLNFMNIAEKQIYALVYICPKCSKLEFYNKATKITEDKPKEKAVKGKEETCQRCGQVYETVYGHCAYCGWQDDET